MLHTFTYSRRTLPHSRILGVLALDWLLLYQSKCAEGRTGSANLSVCCEIITNPQKIVTQLCTSPRLYRAFNSAVASFSTLFWFSRTQLNCFDSLSSHSPCHINVKGGITVCLVSAATYGQKICYYRSKESSIFEFHWRHLNFLRIKTNQRL